MVVVVTSHNVAPVTPHIPVLATYFNSTSLGFFSQRAAMAIWLVNGLRGLFSVLGCLMLATLLYSISTDGLPFRRDLLTPYVHSFIPSLCVWFLLQGMWKVIESCLENGILVWKWKWVCVEISQFCMMRENSMKDEENCVEIGLGVVSEVEIANEHEIGWKKSEENEGVTVWECCVVVLYVFVVSLGLIGGF